MWKELFVLLSCFTLGILSTKTLCRQDSECGTDECCYYHEGPMIASKKRQVFPNLMPVQGGWCEKYKLEGAHCNSFEKMNGHCECGPGLKCTLIKDPTLTVSPIIKRGMIFGGHEECRPTNP